MQGRGEVLEVIDDPQIIPPNSTVLFIIENRSSTSSQDVSSIVQWCEPERIPGLSIVDGSFVRYSGKLL